MTNYDFLNISPYEFEILCRDLLQAELNIRLEAFGLGADEGIDLRYSKGENIIVQCKRYKDYNSLYQSLKNEVLKVDKLKPNKYLITTSVSLSPQQKNMVIELFSPYIKHPEDIYTKEDLNNLISRHPQIEKNHFKLWLSSTNVLHTILNSQIVNQGRFVLDEIKDKINLYVQNESYFEALNTLVKNKYVVISGIPGIGKTTLAQILVYDLLAKGVEEFVFLSDSIKEGYQLYNENKSQVYLFDDFLGRNFLENSISNNEESQILRFIAKIQRSENKLLIFTTREYILNQAQLKYDKFDDIEFKKCVIDLSKYTTLIKAKILYNHLFFNKIPFSYIEEIISQGYLMQLINHRNYNPRIIESFTHSELWSSFSIKEFPSVLIETFDYPDTIWKHAYENQISELSRHLLCCLSLFNGKIDFDNLFEQLKIFTKKINYEKNVDYLSFKKCLRELDNSFIQTKMGYQNQINISFQNPSIQDFLLNYLDDDNQTKQNLIISSIYLKPLLDIFSNKDNSSEEKHRFSLDSSIEKFLFDHIINAFDDFDYSQTIYLYSKPSTIDIEILKLSTIVFNNIYSEQIKMKEFIISRIHSFIYSDKIGSSSVNDYYSLVDKFNEELNPNFQKIMKYIMGFIWEYDDLWILKDFESNYPEEYEKFIEENEEQYDDVIYSIVSEVATRNSENLEDDLEVLIEIENDFYIDTQDERNKIELIIETEKEDSYSHSEENYVDRIFDYHPVRYYNNEQISLNFNEEEFTYSRSYSEEEDIENMFNSLKDNEQ